MLVERDDEIRALREALEALSDGVGAVFMVLGEPGIGKTALVNEVLTNLPSSVRLWAGGCDELLRPGSLDPIREALNGAQDGALEAESRGELHHFLMALTRELSQGPPTVLVVEDLQWADDATLNVVTYLSRRIERFPLLIVLSYREEDLGSDHSLHRYLAAISPHSTQLRLQPLSRAGVATMCAGSNWDPTALWELTGGNPFFTVQSLTTAPVAPVARMVAAAVASRLRCLSTPARAVLERMSVWPGTLSLDLAEAFLGDALAALPEAEARGLVRADRDGVSFRHELTRLATLAALPVLQRRRHARDAVALLVDRRSTDRPELIRLAVTGDDPATIVRFGPHVAQAASRCGATEEAVWCYEAVLRHQARLDAATLIDVLYGYAGELRKANRLAQAITTCRRAADLCAGTGDAVGRARALARLSRYLYWSAALPQARASAEQAVALSRDLDDAVAADALASLGLLMGQQGAAALPVLDRARALAGQAQRRDLLAMALDYLAQCSPRMTQGARLELLRAGIDVARDADAGEAVCRGRTTLAELLHRFGRYDELDRLLPPALREANSRGCRADTLSLEVCSALLMLRRGQWDSAAATLRLVHHQAPEGGLLADFALAPYGRLLARRGDPAAEDLLTGCWERASAHRWLPVVGLSATALVEWAWLAGDTGLVSDVAQAWAQHAGRPGAAPFDAELRRFARLAGVDVPKSEAEADVARTPWAVGLSGRWREAVQCWRELGDDYAMALELADSGDDRSTLQAWHLLNDLGAVPGAQWVRRRLRALGVRSIPRGPTPGTRSNPGGLTDRQMEVANLMREGLTNPEIAARLMVSVRTVDHHVSSVLAKLGLRTRREVMGAAGAWGPRHPKSALTRPPRGLGL